MFEGIQKKTDKKLLYMMNCIHIINEVVCQEKKFLRYGSFSGPSGENMTGTGSFCSGIRGPKTGGLAVYMQTENRIHRMGRKDSVLSYSSVAHSPRCLVAES